MGAGDEIGGPRWPFLLDAQQHSKQLKKFFFFFFDYSLLSSVTMVLGLCISRLGVLSCSACAGELWKRGST